MNKLKVLIVNCPSKMQVYQDLAKLDYSAIEPPVWAGLIALYLRKREISVEILDAEAEGITTEETATRIIDANAMLSLFIVYGHQPSASTQSMPAAIAVHKLVKEADCSTITMFMGTHSAAIPEETLADTGADLVCTGEGPYTVHEVIRSLAYKHDFMKCCVPEIGSLCFKSDGKIVRTDSFDLISDLDDQIPGVAWDLLDMKKYRAHNWHCFDHINDRQPYASLYTSLGCPFKCEFCCINAPFSKATIRYLSPEYVMKEIKILVEKYGVKNIKIPDEMFVLHRHHVIGLCDLIIESGYDLNIWAYARIDTIQDDFLSKLKQAGFNWLALGIESGSEFVRDGAKKKLHGDDIIATVQKIQSHGIYVVGNYIFGLPDDTHETMQKTLDLATYLNTEWANFYCAMAYPGSPLHRMARKNGTALPEDQSGPGWIGYSQHAYETFPLPTDTLTNGEVLKFRDQAHMQYFESESYLMMVRSKFGSEVESHILKMNAVALRRKYIGV